PVGEGEGVPVAAGGRARPAATVAAAAPTALPRTQGGPLELAWDVPGQVKAGEEFQVALRASADSPLRTGSFQFRYDPRQLEVLKVDEGDYFKKSSVNMVLTEKVEPPAGRIVVTLAPSGESAGAAGSGALIVIRFKALAANPNAQVSMLAAQGRDASDRLMQIKGFGPAQFAIGP
ncbi:MAG TPA: cohesin domain-containing protein, partial [Pelomicrobium sp.]|nr:cohesin domain-containing protein [Pelomicrobium sp.]